MTILKNIDRWLKEHTALSVFGSSVITAIVTVCISLVVDLGGDNRAGLAAEVQEVQVASAEVETALAVYLNTLSGEGTVGIDELDSLQQSLLNLRQQVLSARAFAPELDADAAALVAAMIELRSTAASLENAYSGGREFLEALGEYQYTRDRFEAAARHEETRFKIFWS
jgi:hypothetical protein